MPVDYKEPFDDNDIPISSHYVPDVGFVGVQGSPNINTDGSAKRSSPVNLNLKQVGDVLFALGQALKAGSIPVVLPSDQTVPISASSLPLPTGAATQTTLANVLAQLQAGIPVNTISNYATENGNLAAAKADLDTLVPGIQGWIAVTGNGTANQENTLTFAQQVRKVVLYNASANNVPLEFDQTASATSFPIPPGAYWIIDNVLCTTVHVYPSATLPINTTNGLYVKGWK